MHTDKAHRDSMTLDILEPLRPTIDRHIKRLTDLRRFRRSDFLERLIHFTAGSLIWSWDADAGAALSRLVRGAEGVVPR